RRVIVPLIEGGATVGVGLLDHGTKFGVVNEVEAMRSRRMRRCSDDGSIVRTRQRVDGLLEDVEQSLDDFGRHHAFNGAAIVRTHQEGFAKRTGEPMGLAASGELVDGYATVL